MLTLLLIGMLTLAFSIQPFKAEGTQSVVTDPSGDPLSGYLDDSILEGYVTSDGTIHWGSGVVNDSEYFNFGMGDIFWSIANEERGYFYGSSFSTPTVFFADKIEDYWGSYDSYQGVQHIWEFTSASDHEWFTQHSITFAEETSPYFTGILLIRQGDLYGAIKPKCIHNGDLNHPEDYVLEYDWWYDDSGDSDFSSLKPNYVFMDSLGRGTTLKINTEHNFFQFITPDRDYGIRKATYILVRSGTITIRHKDNELKLFTRVINAKQDFCIAHAKDMQTYKRYWLMDKVGTEG